MSAPDPFRDDTMPKRVLLVEDNADNRAICQTILEHGGYAVVEAVNGEAAIPQARESKPDLILMDISIPLIDGWTATTTLKRDPLTASIPISALTAYALADDRARAVAAGCDGYLAKPVEPRRVLEEVGRHLGDDREASPVHPSGA